MILGIDASQANREIRSGTEWYAFYLIQEFKKLLAERKDTTVRLYTCDQLRQDLAKDLPSNFEVRVLHWPLRYFWAQARLSLEMLIDPPDVLFCPAHTIPLIHPGDTLTTVHDIGFVDNPRLYDQFSLWYHKFSAWWAARKAHHIFTVSNFSKQRIIKNYHHPSERITVTYLGIDKSKVETFRNCESIQQTLDKYRLKCKEYILFIGRLEPKKNIRRMVEAFEIANLDLQFVLAGRKVRTGDIDQYLAKNPELAGKIKFLGYFDEADKPALYQGAKLFLFPTLYEGFGLPIIEAQASGTPVITSRATSNEEVAGAGAVLVDPENSLEIAHAIETLLKNSGLREQIVREGYRNIERFNWQKTAEQTLEEIINKPPSF